MTSFVVIGHQAKTDGSFSLSDLAGGAGRLDLLCRSVQASLFLSHGVRQDGVCLLILAGGPGPAKTVRFSGDTIRSLSPDERSSASFIRKALEVPAGSLFREVTPGVSVRKGGLETILQELQCGVLDEGGTDVRKEPGDLPEAFILSDHHNFTLEEEDLIRDLPRYSLGPEVLHADHAIVLLLNEIDRRRSGWN